jgi:hypothetical protein
MRKMPLTSIAAAARSGIQTGRPVNGSSPLGVGAVPPVVPPVVPDTSPVPVVGACVVVVGAWVVVVGACVVVVVVGA